jgi:hypothetical protein
MTRGQQARVHAIGQFEEISSVVKSYPTFTYRSIQKVIQEHVEDIKDSREYFSEDERAKLARLDNFDVLCDMVVRAKYSDMTEELVILLWHQLGFMYVLELGDEIPRNLIKIITISRKDVYKEVESRIERGFTWRKRMSQRKLPAVLRLKRSPYGLTSARRNSSTQELFIHANIHAKIVPRNAAQGGMLKRELQNLYMSDTYI